MSADMIGYSALAQKNEALSLELFEEYRQLLRSLFPRYGGREVDTTGDELFVEFIGALQAARCALEIQKILYERNAAVPAERQIRARMGLHVGEVIHLGEPIHGDKVNVAARIYPLAEPRGICLMVSAPYIQTSPF